MSMNWELSQELLIVADRSVFFAAIDGAIGDYEIAPIYWIDIRWGLNQIRTEPKRKVA